MKLTEEQQGKVRDWAAQGDTLGDIQKKLEEEFEVQVTYMEARLLVADLEVSIQDREKEKPVEASDSDLAIDGEDAGGLGSGDEETLGGSGGVTVSLDSIAQPEAMVSGTVSFSDGESARWAVDLTGRLALDPDTAGYRPSEEDFIAFQNELHDAVRRAGL